MDKVTQLYEHIVDPALLIRRVNITANHVVEEAAANQRETFEQLDLFTDYQVAAKKQRENELALEKEKRLQKAMISIKSKYGKNAVLRGMNLQEGAMTKERNRQIGGHKA
jgi:DNA polymerase V